MSESKLASVSLGPVGQGGAAARSNVSLGPVGQGGAVARSNVSLGPVGQGDVARSSGEMTSKRFQNDPKMTRK